MPDRQVTHAQRKGRSLAAWKRLLTGCVLGLPGVAYAVPYNDGPLVNFNGTFDTSVIVTAVGNGVSGVVVNVPGVTTTLLDNITISTSAPGNPGFAHAILTSAGQVNLTGNIVLNVDSLAGSGVRADGDSLVSLNGQGFNPVTINLLSGAGTGTPPQEAAGLYAASGNAAILVLGPAVIDTSQQRGYGLWNLSTAGHLGIWLNSNVTITTRNSQSFGIRQDTGDTLISGGTIINTLGPDASPGIRGESGTLTFGDFLRISTVSGPAAVGSLPGNPLAQRFESGYGIWNSASSGLAAGVNPTGAQILVLGSTTINTTGAAAFGIYNDTPQGTITLNGPTNITTTGGAGSYTYYLTLTPTRTAATETASAYGVNSSDGFTTFNAPATISASGVGAGGVRMFGGTVTFNDTASITATNSTGHGVNLLTNSAGRVGLLNFNANTNIAVSGANANAVNVSAGTANFAGFSTLSATGAGGFGVLVSGGQANFTAPTTISSATTDAVLATGGAVTMTAGATIANVAGGAFALHSMNSGVINAAGQFLINGNMSAQGPSTITLTATNASTITGDASAEANSRFDIKLFSDSTWTGRALNVTNVGVDPSIWTITGDSTVSQTTTNQGVIQFTPPTGGVFKTLTTTNYVGLGGILGINTFLGNDASPSDKLVINGGTATGTGILRVTNAGGPGDQTTGNGILVVQAVNGGTTQPGLFTLGNAVAAGAYEYMLFRGGVTAGSENDWFLRSHIISPPSPPGPPPPPVPLFRPEAPLYSSLPAIARASTLATLDTFHERQGEQFLLRGNQNFSAAWGRVFGQHTDQRFEGPFQQEFNGTITGFQAGIDVLGWERGLHRDRAGLFAAFTQADMDVRGFALGTPRAPVGNITLDSTSVGAYWTHIGPAAWYVDTVVMGTFFDSNARSIRGQFGISPDGTGITASVESGVPIWLGPAWTIEPQAQLIFQHVDFDDAADPFSRVEFHPDDSVTGRLGLRLTNTFQWFGATIQPYLRANVWHQVSGTDVTVFRTTSFGTPIGSTSVEVGGGVVASLNGALGMFATGSYVTDVSGVSQETFKGRVGMRYTW